jgi:hypothetical protein
MKKSLSALLLFWDSHPFMHKPSIQVLALELRKVRSPGMVLLAPRMRLITAACTHFGAVSIQSDQTASA